jgi:hypothetical protein
MSTGKGWVIRHRFGNKYSYLNIPQGIYLKNPARAFVDDPEHATIFYEVYAKYLVKETAKSGTMGEAVPRKQAIKDHRAR